VGTHRQKALFLDRDGIINESVVVDGKPYAPRKSSDLKIVVGAREALVASTKMGFLNIVVSNQPDVARGTTEKVDVEKMNSILSDWLPLDDIFVCYHDGNTCRCRKPKPGMILDAAEKYDIDLTKSFMLGDRRGDIYAGYAAGCRTIFLNRRYREEPPVFADFVITDIKELPEILYDN